MERDRKAAGKWLYTFGMLFFKDGARFKATLIGSHRIFYGYVSMSLYKYMDVCTPCVCVQVHMQGRTKGSEYSVSLYIRIQSGPSPSTVFSKPRKLTSTAYKFHSDIVKATRRFAYVQAFLYKAFFLLFHLTPSFSSPFE